MLEPDAVTMVLGARDVSDFAELLRQRRISLPLVKTKTDGENAVTLAQTGRHEKRGSTHASTHLTPHSLPFQRLKVNGSHFCLLSSEAAVSFMVTLHSSNEQSCNVGRIVRLCRHSIGHIYVLLHYLTVFNLHLYTYMCSICI